MADTRITSVVNEWNVNECSESDSYIIYEQAIKGCMNGIMLKIITIY